MDAKGYMVWHVRLMEDNWLVISARSAAGELHMRVVSSMLRKNCALRPLRADHRLTGSFTRTFEMNRAALASMFCSPFKGSSAGCCRWQRRHGLREAPVVVSRHANSSQGDS